MDFSFQLVQKVAEANRLFHSRMEGVANHESYGGGEREADRGEREADRGEREADKGESEADVLSRDVTALSADTVMGEGIFSS